MKARILQNENEMHERMWEGLKITIQKQSAFSRRHGIHGICSLGTDCFLLIADCLKGESK
jgi:hypothetical protein